MECNLETGYRILFDRDTIQAIPEFPMFPALQEPSFSRLVSDRTDREDEQLAILLCWVGTSCQGSPSPSGSARIDGAVEPARNINMGGIWLYWPISSWWSLWLSKCPAIRPCQDLRKMEQHQQPCCALPAGIRRTGRTWPSWPCEGMPEGFPAWGLIPGCCKGLLPPANQKECGRLGQSTWQRHMDGSRFKW